MADESSERRDDSLSVAWIDIVRFVRQLSHDLRNQLNAAELQSAYIAELAQDAELKAEIKRLRQLNSELGTMLQKLSAGLGQPKPNLMPYRAADLIEDLRRKIAGDLPDEIRAISWDIQLGDAMLNVDPQLLLQILIELFKNAFQHERGTGVITATAKVDNDRFVFTLREPKTQFDLPTEKWGREPLRRGSRGHYGLGLNRARVIVEAHNGELRAQYDSASSTLVTTITLPLSSEQG
jgi:K+-sensing histidine kinase KdpD